MSPTALHPASLTALLASARAHELAADVLRGRDATASTAHTELALRLRARASTTTGGA